MKKTLTWCAIGLLLIVTVVVSLTACSSSSGSGTAGSSLPSATNTSAYKGGYAFGDAAGVNVNGPEGSALDAAWNLALPVGYACNELNANPSDASSTNGVPSDEVPPGGSGAAAQQWVNGCVKGFTDANADNG